MISKIFHSLLEGREDAKATIAQRDFLAVMASIESFSSDSQELIAFSFVHAMKGFAKQARATLPEHCHQDYIQFMDSSGLKLVAEHYFSQARIHKAGGADLPTKAAGLALELVGYYLVSRSWQDLNHTINIDAIGNSATMIGLDIEERIHAFLKKSGQTLPRSC